MEREGVREGVREGEREGVWSEGESKGGVSQHDRII